MLNLIHQCTNIIGYRIHTECVETAIQHVSLNANLVERLTESTNSQVRILTCHQVHLLKGTTIGFYSGKTAHIDNGGRNAFQLVFTRLEFA